MANLSDWLKSDAEKFYDIREAYPEYADLEDLDFARRMLNRIQNIADAPEQERDRLFTMFLRRVPQYREYSRTQLQNELIRLLSRAVGRFST